MVFAGPVARGAVVSIPITQDLIAVVRGEERILYAFAQTFHIDLLAA